MALSNTHDGFQLPHGDGNGGLGPKYTQIARQNWRLTVDSRVSLPDLPAFSDFMALRIVT